MKDDIVTKDCKNSAEKIKVQRGPWKFSKKWRKLSEVTNAASCYWPTKKEKYLKHLKPTTNIQT